MGELVKFSMVVGILGLVAGAVGYELLVRFLVAVIPYVVAISNVI